MANLQSKLYLAAAVVAVAFAVYLGFELRHEREMRVAGENDLAKYMPLEHINDSLAFRVVTLSQDLNKEVSDKSQLKQQLTARDEQILALSNMKAQVSVESVFVQSKRSWLLDHWVRVFDTGGQWWSVTGWYDTNAVHITDFEAGDSLTTVFTRSENDLFYGYVQNHSPFVKIRNADFTLDASQFISRPSSVWKYAAIIEAGIIILKFLK